MEVLEGSEVEKSSMDVRGRGEERKEIEEVGEKLLDKQPETMALLETLALEVNVEELKEVVEGAPLDEKKEVIVDAKLPIELEVSVGK